ncbi:NAD(P)H-flavin reductase [Paraferrimonas haliotis]|uniref:NAD(P)H-flavin reductase n=1 Tax=Paraferrimonas haliotis TaxID=2013866 RepID=A0AA37TQ04_9GAMM|nr:NAD(P)H-flavin reductase [Paraferrimonas haliotis]GLS82272.1 NAD(P)H-flavin reductase [Paraferrimonas haliotis]
MKRISCKVDEISKLNDYVYRVRLSPESETVYQPGQYLQLVLSDEDKRIFSIASAPHQAHIELHIGAAQSDDYPRQAIEHLQANAIVEIELASGLAFLREDTNRPRLLIAGGTGFSYVHSMLQHMLTQTSNPATTVIWGCRNSSDMYYYEQMQDWANAHPWLEFIAVIEQQPQPLTAHQGMLLDTVCQLYPDLSQYDVYLAGRFEMAKTAKPLFSEHKVNPEHLFGDAFSFV